MTDGDYSSFMKSFIPRNIVCNTRRTNMKAYAANIIPSSRPENSAKFANSITLCFQYLPIAILCDCLLPVLHQSNIYVTFAIGKKFIAKHYL